jgi:isopenicillin-N N-acyltransferase-like protein
VRTLELPAGQPPRAWGRIHGESFRGEVQSLTAIRVYLCTTAGRGNFTGRAGVLAAAERHLPVLQRWDEPLYEELVGLAEGANLSPAEIVVANHYTDLRDLSADPASWRYADGDGGCSLIWSRTPSGSILAQTWDMHATALPFAMMLILPDAVLLTLTGCVGLAGMNRRRAAIAINNLNSTDATIGVVWPALVRRALRCGSAREAKDAVMAAPVGSGHHYFVADPKDAFAIETSGTRKKVVFSGEQGEHYLHTNHCLDGEIEAMTRIPEGSTSHARYALLEQSLARGPVRDLDDVWTRLGSTEGWPASVCTNQATPENPHGSATCGAIAMNLDTGEVWGQGGFVNKVKAERFHV